MTASKHFPHPGQKRRMKAEQKPNQKLKYDFQKAEITNFWGIQLSCMHRGWAKKNHWVRSNYLGTINITTTRVYTDVWFWTTGVKSP